jgi:hypothetical protein
MNFRAWTPEITWFDFKEYHTTVSNIRKIRGQISIVEMIIIDQRDNMGNDTTAVEEEVLDTLNCELIALYH